MLKRLVLSMALMLGLSAAAPPPSAPASPAPAPALVGVAINTQLGTITLALDAARAPLTTANFLRYVDQRRFDGTAFYRAMKLSWGEQPNGLIQGGTQNDPRRVLRPVAHEPTSQTGIRHKAGTISMARFAPGTATGDFSIMVADMEGLDAVPSSDNPEFRAGFAAFGHVVSGMDVVLRIHSAPVSATLGQGVMKGEMLEPKVRILTVRRVALPAASAPAETGAPPAP